jgi:hypothetical protein
VLRAALTRGAEARLHGTSIGDPSADVGHCRVNLARALGLGAADRFLELTGIDDYHPRDSGAANLNGPSSERRKETS